MVDSNIAGLPAGATIADTDLIAGSDAGSGTLVKKTGLQFNTYIQNKLSDLPTTDPHLLGVLWNNGGLVAISQPFVRALAGDTGAYSLSGSTATLVNSAIPTFQIDFTAISVLPAQVTLTRASAATYFDSSGVLQTAAINAPRFDHSPATLAARGLLIEETRTNLFLTSTAPANQTITVVNATSYTVSFYGTGSLTLTGAVAHTVTGSSATVLTSYTFTSGSTSLVIAVSGSVVSPNVEAGDFATSPIITAGTPVVRSADIVQLAGTADTLLQAAAASIVVETSLEGIVVNSRLVAQNDGNGFTPLYVFDATTVGAYDGFAISTPINGGVSFMGNIVRAGSAWDASNTAIVANGGTVATMAHGFSLPASTYLFSRSGSSDFTTGWLRKLYIYDSRLPSSNLQTATQ